MGHLACHGATDLEHPAESALLIHDYRTAPLTVADVVRLRLRQAELAYLSACDTAQPGVRLLDESIHLASAFQAAGYRHVIATMWPVWDLAALTRRAVDLRDACSRRLGGGLSAGRPRRGLCRPPPCSLHPILLGWPRTLRCLKDDSATSVTTGTLFDHTADAADGPLQLRRARRYTSEGTVVHGLWPMDKCMSVSLDDDRHAAKAPEQPVGFHNGA